MNAVSVQTWLIGSLHAMNSGSLYHTCCPVDEKAHSPSLVLTDCSTIVITFDECRFLDECGPYSWGLHCSV